MILASVLVVAIGVSAYFIVTSMIMANIADGQPSTGGIGFVLDENAKDDTDPELENRGGAAEGIKIPGYGTVRLPSGKTEVKMKLLNPEGNPCYFVFDLIIDGETYYSSKYVEPGKYIEDLTLTKTLVKGEYTAILRVSTYSLDESHSKMNGADVKFELVVS